MCDTAMFVVKRVQRRVPFRIEKVNIELDSELFAKFRHDIPVGLLNGEEVFRHRVDEQDLVAHLLNSSSKVK